jgi:DegV family protein with EDD domain
VISLGMLFLARASAKAAAAGATVDAIKKMIEGMIPRTHIYVLLDTLEYVRRGGRIGRARAFIGTMMRVKPVLSIRDGEVHPEERVRTRVHALDRVFQMATSFPEIEEIGVAYSTNAQEAEGMRRRLQEALGDKKVEVTRLGPVIGVHGGPGVLGIGILEGER